MIIVEQFFEVRYFHCDILIALQVHSTNRFSVLYCALKVAKLSFWSSELG